MKKFSHTEETKKRLSELAKKQWREGRASTVGLFKKGFKHTEEQKKRISEKLSKIQLGEGNSNWRGGTTINSSSDRRTKKHINWRMEVLGRDMFLCRKCSKKSKKLNVHHIKNYSKYPELRFDIDNGITLCEDCHKKFHKAYGKYNNNFYQLTEFLCEYQEKTKEI